MGGYISVMLHLCMGIAVSWGFCLCVYVYGWGCALLSKMCPGVVDKSEHCLGKLRSVLAQLAFLLYASVPEKDGFARLGDPPTLAILALWTFSPSCSVGGICPLSSCVFLLGCGFCWHLLPVQNLKYV